MDKELKAYLDSKFAEVEARLAKLEKSSHEQVTEAELKRRFNMFIPLSEQRF